MTRIFFAFIGLCCSTLHVNAKVDPPNYNFNLDELKPFYPNSNFDQIKAKYKKLKLLSDDGKVKQYKVQIKKLRYNFPLIFHIHKGKVLDFYTRLPSYFLHDVFHQSLINRFKKQDQYQLKNGTAIYKWNQRELQQVYSSTCTITCFPVFYTVYKKSYQDPDLKGFIPYHFKTKSP